MLTRRVSRELLAWKNADRKKCLIVQGARQVGKTFIIEDFARRNYDETVEINFKELPSAREVFAGDLDVDTMVTALRFRFPDKKILPGKTLIFLDEIQECPEALTSLKFWTLDGRYDVIASGSLLGIDYRRASSYPVGYVDYLHMHALDFEEFLWAIGISSDLIDSLRGFFTSRKPVPEAVHTQMMAHFRTFLALGGMPEVVQRYVDTHDFREADAVQRALLQGYQYDIAHYASPEEKVKAEKCYLSLARQLLDKENHKFQYKEVEHGARAQKYYSSIDWLVRADMVHLCRRVTDLRYDLDDYVQSNFFRAYTTDLSLLLAMKDFGLKQHIIENTLLGNSKGGLYECAIADILHKKGYQLYFYKNESLRRELDFVIEKDGAIIPIEVKSGNTRATSLTATMKMMEKSPDISAAYKLVDGNVGTGGGTIGGDKDSGSGGATYTTLPLYMAMFL
ncbi:MAG: ATP-binding protein [Bifidobacteriaceae bacterium]|nr:ATP-binding protein [Bifidobacteriaceae bacterium]